MMPMRCMHCFMPNTSQCNLFQKGHPFHHPLSLRSQPWLRIVRVRWTPSFLGPHKKTLPWLSKLTFPKWVDPISLKKWLNVAHTIERDGELYWC